MDNEEKKCDCRQIGRNHRKNLVYFGSLDLTVYSVEDPRENKTIINVSGHRCPVCGRIELMGGSWIAINAHLKMHHRKSIYDTEKRLKDVVIENRAENLSYIPFNLFIYGNSPLR